MTHVGKKKKRKRPCRRVERKKARAKKKAKKVAFFSKSKEQGSIAPNNLVEQNKKSAAVGSDKTDPELASTVKKKRKRKRKGKSSTSQDTHLQRLVEDNKKEEKEIKRLEKLLRLNKKKNVPSKFRADGLDFLLEVCDLSSKDADDKEDESSDEVDSSSKRRISKTKVKESKNKSEEFEMDIDEEELNEESEEENDNDDDDVTHDNSDSEGDDSDDDDDDDDDDDKDDDDDEDEDDDDLNSQPDEEDGIKGSDGDDSVDGSQSDNEPTEPGHVQSETPQKYVPPHLRKQPSSEAQREHLNRIRRQMKGLLNRLSEGNLSVISSEIENLFTQNSRNEMNKILSDIILDSCVSVSLMPDKLLMEHVMLLAILTNHIGTEVGAFFVERLAELFDELHKDGEESYGQGKECFNVATLFAHLYNFKIIHCCLIYDIIRRLATSFTGQDVELLLLLLKSTGAEIRRDDPASLKDIILQIQAKAASATGLSSDSRVRFMLEIISNLRNNNLRKIPGYDPSQIEHLRKVLRSVTRESSRGVNIQLKINLDDLLKAEVKGRWWIVGSAWSGKLNDSSAAAVDSTAQLENSKLLELARKQRMNTDVRKNVFLVVMTSEDYIDAFEKLLRLNLKDVQAREIVHVLIDCCLQEKTYNPYYAYLGQKFCEYSRSYQVTFQYSFWDKFKLLSDLSSHSLSNLSRIMCHLIATRALSLAVLKVVNFVELDKPSVRLFTQMFRHILVDYSPEITRNVFERISTTQELATLRQSLRIFIKHFVGKTKSSKSSNKDSDLQERLKLADGVLGASDGIKL